MTDTTSNNLYKYRNKIIISKESDKLCCYINGFATRDHDSQRDSNNNHFIDSHLKQTINNYNTKILLNIKLENPDNNRPNFDIFTLTQKKIMNFFSIYFINNDTSKIRLLLKNKYNIINNDNSFNYLLNYNQNNENIYNNVNDTDILNNINTFFDTFDTGIYYYQDVVDNTDSDIIKLRKILTSTNLISFNFDNRFNSSNYFKLPILKTHTDYYNNFASAAATADATNHVIIYTGTNLNNNFQNNLLIHINDSNDSKDPLIISNGSTVNNNSLCLYTRPIDNSNNYLRFEYINNSDININFDMNFSIINTGYNENKIYFKKSIYTGIIKNTLFITGKLLKKNDYAFMNQNKKKIFLSLGNGICGINSISLCNNLHLGSTTGARNNAEKKFIFTDVNKLFNPNFLVNLDFNFQLNHNEYYVNNFYYNKFNKFFKEKSDNLNNYYHISYTPLLKNDYKIINNDDISISYKKNKVDFLYSDEIKYKINIKDNKFDYDFKFNYNKLIEFDLNVGVNFSTNVFPFYNFDIVNRIFILDGSDFTNVNCVFLYNDINNGPNYKYPYNNIDICNNPSIDTISKTIVNFKFNADRNKKNYSIIPLLNNNNLTKKQIYSYIATNNIPKLLSIIPKDNESFTVGRDEGLNLRSEEPVICNNDELSQRKKFKAVFENKYNQNNKVNNNNLNKRNFAKIVRSSNIVRKKLLSCNDF
tara:strand:+ start:17858 stop:19966 length:2109 start_codon:yes stop_codon:yes gene_type:complete